MSEKLDFEKLYSSLEANDQELVQQIATGGGLSHKIDILQFLAEELGFDINESLERLTNLGLVEQVSWLQELQEQLAALPKPRTILLIPDNEVPVEQLAENLSAPSNRTEEEQEWFRLKTQLDG